MHLSSDKITGLVKASFLLPALIALLLIGGCDHAPEVVKISGSKFGTSYHITIVADQPAPADLAEQIDAALDVVDLSMSTYKSESELSLFNRLPATETVAASPELWTVLQTSRQVWQQSAGAFDPTVGPLVDLWGFGPQMTNDRIPSDDEIAKALASIGYQYLVLNSDEQTISKALPLRLDLSAVAKGYAVDQVADLLEMLALPDYLVEVGGEMRVSGLNPKGQLWRIAIETPDAMGQVDNIIALESAAIATSGDYRNYFEKDGKRYSHSIDPRTGRPIEHRLASVTVVADHCIDADAWATAFLVMGDEAALEIANQQSIAVYMLVKAKAEAKDQFTAVYSDAFKQYLTAPAVNSEN
jgi:thiamine biosynthesis lipoprotein